MKYDNFVFYGSWRESLEGFREEFGDDYAKEALWNLMLAATAGDIETERKSIIGFISGAVMPNVNKAKDRYAAAVENGKKGGRPKKIDENKALELKQKGMTNKQVAEALGCSVSSIEKINAENRKNQNNQNNQNNQKNQDIIVIENQETRKNQKNLDKDKDIDIEKEKEKENKKEKDIFAFSWFDEEEEEERKKKVVESARDTRLAAIRKNRDDRFMDEEEQEYFDFIKGANIKNGMSSAAAEADAWEMILDEREYNVSKIS